MVTAADGAEEAYLANMKSNVARYENLDEARATDKALKNVWTGHPHLRIVDNSTEFSEKITRVMTEICAVIGKPAPLEIERKILIKQPDIKEIAKYVKLSMTQIVQTYLCDDGSGVERRIRMRGLPGDYTFFYTEKKTVSPGVRIETERKISEREYFDYLFQSDCEKRQIKKTRFCFIYKNLYYELDIYPFWKDLAILEIELSSEASKFTIPEFITPIREVTDDSAYSNYHLASELPK
jgi:CYTH domain-containing protein